MCVTLIKANLSLLLMTTVLLCRAQTNCRVFTDSCHIKACLLYNAADTFPQGSQKSQQYYDSAIRICPDYAEAWRAISIPYLKRGDFYTWRKYLDKAVQLKPRLFLGIRGWCLFKFLRDYEGALNDLHNFDTLTAFHPSYSGDGNYHLYVVMAICYRELGNYQQALQYFSLGIDSIVAQQGEKWVGLSDYLHRAVTKMRTKDYAGALLDLERQIKRYDNYAEIYYYQGLTLQFLHRPTEALATLQKAQTLAGTGHHLSDIYCEMPDEVFMDDINMAIEALHASLGRKRQ